jgi:hypothetical protein
MLYAKASGLLGRYAVLSGEQFPTFQGEFNLNYYLTSSTALKNICCVLNLFSIVSVFAVCVVSVIKQSLKPSLS